MPPTTNGTDVKFGAWLQVLGGVAESLQGRDVDAVLLVDRLDFYRVEELDKQVCLAP